MAIDMYFLTHKNILDRYFGACINLSILTFDLHTYSVSGEKRENGIYLCGIHVHV